MPFRALSLDPNGSRAGVYGPLNSLRGPREGTDSGPFREVPEGLQPLGHYSSSESRGFEREEYTPHYEEWGGF